MNCEEISKELWNLLNKRINNYPTGVVKIPDKRPDSTAFFPGGNGYILGTDEPDILVLGQDFGTEDYFNGLVSNPQRKDTDCPTWKNMLALFQEAGICPRRCFYSNVFAGLRKMPNTAVTLCNQGFKGKNICSNCNFCNNVLTGSNNAGSMTGPFPGYKDPQFRQENINFLKLQIERIQPKVVITLGNIPAEMLRKACDSNFDGKIEINKIESVYTMSANNIEFKWVALVHPSMRNSNAFKRCFKIKGINGKTAETEMLKYALG